MTTLGDLEKRGSLLVNDGYRTKRAELGRPGFPILRVAEVGDGFIAPTLADYVRAEFVDAIGSKLSKAGDVLLTTKGTVGRRAIMPDGGRVFAYSPQMCFFRALDDSIDPRWLYYWLGGTDFWVQANGVASQTDMAPYISLRDLRSVTINVPSVDVQRGIAETLGPLDDKIASNRRIARVCLDLAEALYLLSCQEASDEVPLKDTGRWLSGGTPSTSRSEYWGGDLPWISSASLKDFFIADSERRLTGSGAAVATNVVPRESVVFVVRGMSLKTEFRVGLTQVPVAFGQDCKAILPEIPATILAVALWASKGEILELVDEAGHGTGRLSTDLLRQFRISVPRSSSLAGSLAALIERGAVANQESRHLEELRDTLLPELLSGRVSVQKGAWLVDQAATKWSSSGES